MPTAKKEEQVNTLKDILSRSSIVIATDYRGINVSEMNLLRSKLRDKGIDYKVVKNTLAQLAAKQAGKEGLTELLEGPTAIAFGYGDITGPPKALQEHMRSARSILRIKGGLIDGQVLSTEQVVSLATLPSREELIAKVAGGLQAPIYALYFVLTAQLRGLVTVLKARMGQLEEK